MTGRALSWAKNTATGPDAADTRRPSLDAGNTGRPSLDAGNTRGPSLDTGNTGRPSLDVTNTGRPSIDAANTGRSGLPTVSTGRPSLNTANTERPSLDTVNTGRPSLNTANIGLPSLNKVNTARPSLDAANIGRPSLNKANTGRPRLDAANTERPSFNAANIGRPRLDAANTERPSFNAANTGRPSLDAANTGRPSLNRANTELYGSKKPQLNRRDEPIRHNGVIEHESIESNAALKASIPPWLDSFQWLNEAINDTELMEGREFITNLTGAFMEGLDELKERVSTGNFTEVWKEKVGELKEEVRGYLQTTNIKKLKDDARTAVTLVVPQAGYFNSLLRLSSDGGISNFIYLLFIGWPLLLALLYVTLIVLYPNRRTDNVFEKNVVSVVDSMSYVLRAAEDSFLNFMEDITNPQDSYGSASHFRPAYAFPDQHDRQEVYYKPTAFYDEYGQHFDAEYDYTYDDIQEKFDDWGNPTDSSSSFVNPSGNLHNPVSSFNPASADPLREQFNGGDISALAGNFDLQNEIANKDKHNFLNVVLGTQYQHSKPPGSLADAGIVQGTVGPDFSSHPEPPRGFRPSGSSSGGRVYFDTNVDPRLKNQTGTTEGFMPSKLEELEKEEDEWVAKPRPFRRSGHPAEDSETADESHLRFPEDTKSPLSNR
ncbi:uncharacterized protein [Palaemon carinicauda]|uniref:uncharacterized protein n=1 Tax=Palaemon carinicauda TaxID=392227 RepID=UPI0035B5C794